MSSATLPPPSPKQPRTLTEGESVLLEGVSWEQYEALERDLEGIPAKLTYLDGFLEIMAPPPISDEHEGRKSHLGRLIEDFCVAHDINFWKRGSRSLRMDNEAGKEPDEQFFFHQKSERPDLVIEVAISPARIDVLKLYERFQIPEVWIWRDHALEVYILEKDGYRQSEASQVLDGIDLKAVERCARIDSTSEAIREFQKSL